VGGVENKDDLDVFVPFFPVLQHSRLMPLVAHCDFLLTLVLYLSADIILSHRYKFRVSVDCLMWFENFRWMII
jgi:hypothetical protein